jgi:hypothetical protein
VIEIAPVIPEGVKKDSCASKASASLLKKCNTICTLEFVKIAFSQSSNSSFAESITDSGYTLRLYRYEHYR